MDLRKFVDKIRDLGRKDDAAEAPGIDPNYLDEEAPPPFGEAPPKEMPASSSAVPFQPQRPANSVYATHQGDSFYAARAEHVNRVREMFGEFGTQISSHILTQSLTEGGVGRIIVKLGLVTRGRDGADLAQIENWILKNGVESFRKAVGLRAVDAPQPATPDNRRGIAPISATGTKSVGVIVRPLDDEESQNALRRATPRTFPMRDANLVPNSPIHTQKVTVKPVNLAGGPADDSPAGAPDEGGAPQPGVDETQIQRPSGFPFKPRM